MEVSQEQIKELITKEYLECSKNPVHFFRKYCYINHPVKGRVLFNLYPFQEKVLEEFKNNRFNIINKSRQLGISTLTAGYALWLMLFNKDKTVLCIATKQDTAKGMVEKVQFMYKNLPTWLKGKDKPLADNVLSLKLRNNSQIIATSAASDAGRSFAVSLLIMDEAAFIEDIQKIYSSIKPTIATGGGAIVVSTPNGVGNWFHQTFTEAISGKNDFYPIQLKWNVHPDRDENWYNTEKSNMSNREFAQEYDCDFLGSGNSVIDPEVLTFYKETYLEDPIEKRFMGGDFWIWEYPNYNKNYIVCADVARGDGSDYSSFHVLDLEECKQVAEYKSQISTREYGNMLVSVASEYNNAILVVENAGVGWDAINTIIEKSYPNLYYSPRSYGDISAEKYLSKLETEQVVPGFTNSTRTRPLVVSKMEMYIREKTFVYRSKRLHEELRVFIWYNGKAQAQPGYNDDLVMALGIGLFVRDTAARFVSQGNDMIRAALSSITKTQPIGSKYPIHPNGFVNPYNIDLGNGEIENIDWLVR